LVVDLATVPLQLDLRAIAIRCELNLPEGLWDEFFDFLGLVDTEA